MSLKELSNQIDVELKAFLKRNVGVGVHGCSVEEEIEKRVSSVLNDIKYLQEIDPKIVLEKIPVYGDCGRIVGYTDQFGNPWIDDADDIEEEEEEEEEESSRGC